MEEAELVRESDGGDHQVEAAVAVEVLEDRASRQGVEVEAGLPGHVVEAWQRKGGGERAGRYPLPYWDARGIGPQGHVGDVEEPTSAEVVRRPGQDLREGLDGPGGAFAAEVNALPADGGEAGVMGIGEMAILVLGHPEKGGHLEHARARLGFAPADGIVGPRVAVEGLKHLQGLLGAAGVDELDDGRAAQG